MRIALGVEYDGSGFRGWESQTAARTVQSELEAALTRIAREPVRLFCAGRTDARVHACGQVAHFDTAASRPTSAWVLGVNGHLPADVAVNWAIETAPAFHARFSARQRHYRYVIVNRRSRPAVLARHAAWHHRPLDAERMDAAAQWLIGEHDFTSFRASGCQARSATRRIHSAHLERRGEKIYFDVCANAFLQHMVRNIVGTLLEVGDGRRPVDWFRSVLDARDRRMAGITAPPEGLYLTRVAYPAEFGLPSVSRESAVW